MGAEQRFVRQAKVWGCAMSMLQIRQASQGVIAKPLAREVDQWSGGYWDSGHQARKNRILAVKTSGIITQATSISLIFLRAYLC